MLSSNEPRNIIRDSLFTRTLTNIHRKNSLNVLFSSPLSEYPLLRNYCESNETTFIPIEKIDGIDENDCFQEISNYLETKPKDTKAAYIYEQNNSLKLTKLIQEKFPVDLIKI